MAEFHLQKCYSKHTGLRMKFPDKLQVTIQVDSLYNKYSPTAFSIILFKINSFFQL